MADLGKLVVSLEARMASFEKDMGRAAQVTQQSMRQMKEATDSQHAALMNLAKTAAAGISVAAFAATIKAAIDAADHLNDLSKSTGLTVEKLAGLQLMAKQSGTDLDGLAATINKLSVNIGKDAEKYAALGVTAKDPIEAFKQLADIFVAVKDPQDRAAFAAEALGKSWASAAPALAEGGQRIGEMIERGAKLSGVTKDLAEQSDKFNDQLAELELLSGSLGKSLATELLPGLNAITEAMVQGYTEGGKFRAVLMGLDRLGAVLFSDEYADNNTQLANRRKELEELKRVDKQIREGGAVSEFVYGNNLFGKGDADERAASIADLEMQINHIEYLQQQARDKAGKPTAPETTDAATAQKICEFKGGKWQGGKCVMPEKGPADDPRSKQLDGQLRAVERGLAAERNAIAFNDAKVAEMRSQELIGLAAYNAARQKSIDDTLTATLTAYDKEIAALKVYQAQADKKTEKQDAQNKIDDLNAKKAAARQQAAQQTELLTLSLSRAQSQLNVDMREWVILQGQANAQFEFETALLGRSAVEVDKQVAARRIWLDVEERIRQAQKNSATPIDRAAFDKEAGDAIARSNAAIDQRAARENDPWFNAMDSIRRYGEESASVGRQIGEAMTNGFHQAEDALTEFAMTGKFKFSDFANSIIADIVRMQMKKALYGVINGVMNLVSGGAAGAVSAATAATSAQYGGGFADGGEPPLGKVSVVGERGAELFVPKQAGTIIPNGALGGGQQNINFSPVINIDARTDRNEVAALVGRAVNNANRDLVERLQRQRRI